MKAITLIVLALVVTLFFPGCTSIPVLLTGSYSGTTDSGHEFAVGVQVPFGGSGKQPVRASK